MMRFAVVFHDTTIAEFSGYKDAADYYDRQRCYDYENLIIKPINGAKFPDNCREIVDSLINP